MNIKLKNSETHFRFIWKIKHGLLAVTTSSGKQKWIQASFTEFESSFRFVNWVNFSFSQKQGP